MRAARARAELRSKHLRSLVYLLSAARPDTLQKMGWWTRLISDELGTREQQFLSQEVARLESLPQSPRILTALGCLHEWLKDPATAIETYQRALKLNEESGRHLWRDLQLRQRIAVCEGEPPSTPTLEIEQRGQTVHLCTQVCVLGRGSRGTDLVVPSERVAYEHCALWFDDGAWRVCDLGSTNGTTLDGTDLVGTATIDAQAILSLAGMVVRVKILGDPS